MANIIINNKSYVGKSISISGSKVYIDGVLQEDDSKKIYITVQGNIENLDVDNCEKIQVEGDVNTVTSKNGNVITGHVAGDVTNKNGNITCNNVQGDVSNKNGNIKHK